MDRELIIRRRLIGPAELRLVRRLIEQEGERGRSHLSKRLCELWDWRQANGRFRQIACRELLRRLEAKGLVRLPPPLAQARRPGYRNRTRLPERLEREPLEGSLSGFLKDIRLCLVEGAEALAAYAGLIGAYHYLGYRQATGAQLKYWVLFRDRPLACLSFGPAAWKLAARDGYIGWSAETRQARLSGIVNNDRFLLLPWVRVPQLASFVLAGTLRRLRADWQRVYGQELALAETFIERDRFAGACYAAANWIHVGETAGRGRNDRHCRRAVPIKRVWLYPLRPDFRAWLRGPREP